ncbi:MAG: hypothetical protein RLZZ584_2311, partial [Pseudomonadota bacterium]
ETIATAKVIALPSTINGSFSAKTDNDYFRVSVPAGKTVTATMRPNATSDYDLYVHNAAGTRISTSSAGAGQPDTVSFTNAGTAAAVYTLRVVYFSGGVGAAGTYTLTVQ